MRVSAIFFCLLCWTSNGQETVLQQRRDQSFSTILTLYNGENFHAVIPAIHNFIKDYGTNTGYEDELRYFEAIAAARLDHEDAEQKLIRFADEFPTDSRIAPSQFELASLYYRNNNYQKASGQLLKIDFKKLSKSQDLEGRFMLGYSYFNLKRLNEALDQFNFVKGSESIYGPAASYYAGYIELSTGLYENALRDFQRIEKQSSYANVAPYLIAQTYNKMNQDDALIQYVGTLNPQSGIQNLDEIKLLVSEAHFRKKNYTKAIEGYNDFLKGKTTLNRSVLFRAGYSNFSVGNSNEAIEFLKKSASDKDSVGVYSSYYLGICYLKTNQKQLAVTAFQVAAGFKNDPKLAEESSFQYAKLLYDLGRADEAIDEMEKFQKNYLQSNHAEEIGELLSSAYVNASSYHRAIEHIESLSRRTPAIDKAYQRATYFFGTELFNKNEYTRSIEYFNKSLVYPLDPAYAARAAMWSGEAYSIAEDWNKASEYYEKALAYKPEKETLNKIRFGLGYAKFNAKEYDRALFNFKEFVNTTTRSNPELANGYVRLADCYYVSKQYQEAVNTYKTAYNLKLTDQDYAHLQAGVVSGILRMYPQALGELDHVIRNYPQSPHWDEAVYRKAELEFETGNYANAQAGYTRLISSKPASRFVPFSYGRRAASNYNLKEYSKTASDYATLLEQYPSHVAAKDVLLPLQEALNLAGRGNEFDSFLQQFKANNPNAKGIESVEFETAKNFYFNQDYQRAISSLTSFISSYPDSPHLTEARYYKGESYYRSKDSQKALESYYEIFSDDKFTFANRVVGRVAELEFKLGRYEKAIEANQKLNMIATTSKEKHSSWIGLMESFYITNSFDSCLVYANKLINDASVSSPTQNRAALMSGKIAMAKGDYATAQDEFLTIVNNASDESGAEAKYRIAEIHYISKEYKQSYETIIDLNKKYSSYAFWVGKAFLLLADNSVAMDDAFQAKATLKSLIDKFPLEAIREEARVKLKTIEQSEVTPEPVKKDSIDN